MYAYVYKSMCKSRKRLNKRGKSVDINMMDYIFLSEGDGKIMAKKAPVKKTKRRLKRSVRRSLAAVLMVTSIAVAAIPVPENYAVDDNAMSGSGSARAAAKDVHADAVKKDFIYNLDDDDADSMGIIADWASSNLNKFVAAKDINDATDPDNPHVVKKGELDEWLIWNQYDPDASAGNDNGSGPGTPKTYASMVIRDVDGEKTLSWQFMYYVRNIQGSGLGTGVRAVICKYNGEYMAEKVDLPMVLNTKYYTVERNIFQNFFAGNRPDGSALDGGNTSSNWNTYTDCLPNKQYTYTFSDYDSNSFIDTETEYVLKTYFAADLDNQQKIYKSYKDSYDKDTGDYTADPALKEPMTRTPSQIQNPELQKQFYCEHDKILKQQAKAYTLVAVNNQRPNMGGGIVYVAQGGQPAEGYYNDDAGYLVEQRADYLICGIGASAFKGNDRIQNLELPSMISFIGDNAFEGASLIKEITIANASFIGRQAFKDCGSLGKVTIGEGTNTIGAECFYHTAVDSIKLPSTTQDIGYGAFAYCSKLTNLDLNSISQSCKIRDFAFYECPMLKDIKMKDAQIASIGKGAFACTGGEELDFVFPAEMPSYKGNAAFTDKADNTIGDFMFAGRANLKSVVFPEKYGRTETTQVTLPANMFHECTNLSYVEFPASRDQYACGYVSYDGDKLFMDVTNIQFYVKGPKMKNTVDPADPRTNTWSAKMAVENNPIPYLYVENGQEYYEVSNGWYLYCVDPAGVITSCTLTPDARDNHMSEIKAKGINLDILPKVGTRKVTAIGEGCFSDEDLNQNVVSLSIPDDSLTEIANDVFKGWKRMEKVSIGNSVKAIGARAFADCDHLIDVTFQSPAAGYGEEAFTFGEDAFKTGSEKLTFHGDIVKNYTPFVYAMDEVKGKIDQNTGVRICYKSLVPTCQTVMLDANTGYVTLLDYPKYDQIDTLIDQMYEKEYTSLGFNSYQEMREAIRYEEFRVDKYNPEREGFRERWNSAQTTEERDAVYDSEFYGPWINPEFCDAIANGGGTTSGGGNTSSGGTTSGGENTSGGSTGGGDDTSRNALADFLFEPLVVQAAEARPLAFYEEDASHKNKRYSIITNVESDNAYRHSLTEDESALVAATQNIVVPDGVDSIDVNGFMNGTYSKQGITTTLQGTEANKTNANKYLTAKDIGRESYSMYTSIVGDTDDETKLQPGLFSGYYNDKCEASGEEVFLRGNDRVESITLNSVHYLPDYAFDSCEKLRSVILGPNCSDIGTAPFRGCYNMVMVGDNDYYKTQNGIVYSVNTDGSYTIEECLAARGRLVGTALIPDTGDEILLPDSGGENTSKVSAIKPGAFEDCDHITTVDLSGTSVTVIPKDCFRNDPVNAKCGNLSSVTLPRTVNEIQEGAFSNALKLNSLTIPGMEVFISARAFEDNNDEDNSKAVTMVRTHEDSSARRYVNTYGEPTKYNLQWEDIGNQWRVTFFGPDGTVLTDMVDQDGKKIENPQYVEDDTYVKLPTDPVKEGWTFDGWLGIPGNKKVSDRIHQDTNFIAQGHNTDGSVDGQFTVEFYKYDGTKLGSFLVDAGKSFAEMGYDVPQVSGLMEPISWYYNNSPWSPTMVVNNHMAVIAQPNPTSGGSTNTSGNTTNTSGNTTNNNNTSNRSTSTTSTSNTSSSTSSSSTSTSSTTSDGRSVAMYTVLVQNGSGSGSYAQGATVVISAYPPAEGMVFSKWTTESTGVVLASDSTPVTTFVMPGNNVTITANYVAGTAPATNTAGTTGTTPVNNGNTTVDITKPGISNKDLATANVNGSTDNFIVKISETDAATKAVSAALTNKYGNLENILYYAMDITLWDATGTYQLTGDQVAGLSVDITIPIPDALVAYGGNNMAGAVVNGDQLENLNESFTTINGVPCIRFTATHFSPYTIYVDTGNLTEGMLDVTPKTGDPIHPKWFLSIGLACLSIALFMKKDKKVKTKTA